MKNQKIFFIATITGLLICIFIFSSCKTQQKTYVTQLKSNSEQIERGDEVNLNWKVENAENIEIEGIQTGLSNEGNITVRPDTTTTYRMIVYRKGEKPKKKSVTISVVKPEIVSFEANDSISDEEEAVLKWNVRNAQSVSILGIKDSLKTIGNLKIKLDTSRVFTLVAKGKYNSVEKQIKIKMWYREYLSGSDFIYRGNAGKIYWKFKNTNFVKISKINKVFSPRDSVILEPDSTTKYTITAIRKNGNEYKVDHTIAVLSPVLEYFNGPSSIKKEEAAVISWHVKGLDKVLLNNEEVSNRGIRKVYLPKSTTYTLSFKDGKKTISNTITVNVLNSRAFVNKIDTIEKVKRGQRIDCDIIAVDRSNYPNEIKLRILVVDTLGNYISNLAPPYISANAAKQYFKSLTVNINGKEYPLKFEVKEYREEISKPYDISLTLDYSGSMGSTNPILESASKVFIKAKYSKDRISVTKFDDRLVTENPLYDDVNQIIDSARFDGLLRFGRSTALYSGADQGMRAILNSKNQKVMVLFTDGRENASFQYFGMRSFSANQVAAKARESGTKLFIISYGDDTNFKLLWNLANLSGGKHYHIDRAQDILRIFNELPRSFRYYYEITFKPKELDGAHYIKLEYNNMNGATSTTEAMMQIGEKWDLNKYDIDTTSYWYKNSNKNLKPITVPQAVAFFKFDDDKLDDKYTPNFDKYVEYMSKHPKAEILIIGHTDLTGNKQYCYDLSLRRAKEVQEYLIKKGIEAGRIKIEGKGQDNPVWNPDNIDWKAKENRRIEVILFE